LTQPLGTARAPVGTPNAIPTVDGLLAATAHVHGLILATRNVSHIEALDIEWVNPFDTGG
jgi:predicted nucleic acid-binding protein